MRFPIPTRVRLPRAVASLGPYARGGAWFFILFSLAHLAWVVAMKWEDPAGLTTLYQTAVPTLVGEVTHRAWGLAYDGTAGLMLAIAQAAAVIAAAVLSVRRRGRSRRIAHGVLIAWAGLWMADLVHLASLDGRLDSAAAASIATLLFGCTVFRALPRGGLRSTGADGPVGDDTLTRDDVIASGRMVELETHRAGPRGDAAPADDAPDTVRRSDLEGILRAAPSKVTRGCAAMRRRCAPVAAAVGRRGSDAARKAFAHLRAKGVIPPPSPRGGSSRTDVGPVA